MTEDLWGEAERAGAVLPGEDTVQGNVIDVHFDVHGSGVIGNKEYKTMFFSEASSDRRRNNGHKL